MTKERGTDMAIKAHGVIDRKEIMRAIADILATPDLREVHLELHADRYGLPTLTYSVMREVIPTERREALRSRD